MYCNEHVYLSVCLYTRCITQKLQDQNSPHFCACCLRLWLGHPLAVLRYATYFWFCGWRTVLYSGANGQSQVGCYV